MAIGDVYKLNVVWGSDVSEHVCVNDFYFIQNLALVFDEPGEDLVERWRDEVEGAYKETVTNKLFIKSYRVSKAPNFDTEFEVAGLTVLGAAAGDAMSPILSGLLQLRTADLTRRGKSRNFMPPTTETFNTAGHPNASYTDDLLFLANLIVEMDTENVLYARWGWGMYSKTDEEFKPITSYAARGTWSRQVDRARLY